MYYLNYINNLQGVKMTDHRRKSYNMERILDALEILQYNKSDLKLLRVPKRAAKSAKQLLKIKGCKDVKIKTY